MKPIEQKSSLQAVACEIVSAISSLNSPTPDKCAPKDRKHAIEHLNAAMRHIMFLTHDTAVESRERYLRRNRIVEVNIDSLCREIEIDWFKQDADIRASIEHRVKTETDAFVNLPLTGNTQYAISATIRSILKSAIDSGELR
jgi:hypothetical protein